MKRGLNLFRMLQRGMGVEEVTFEELSDAAGHCPGYKAVRFVDGRKGLVFRRTFAARRDRVRRFPFS
jgi:hypothetical protein